jgi:hypothetical protein
MSHKATMTSFTQDELFRLMQHMKAGDSQLHAMALLSLWHGMRGGEVLELTPGNFAPNRRFYRHSLLSRHKVFRREGTR